MGAIDELKGRIKEAAGALTGKKELSREGKADKVAGKAKDAVDTVREKAGAVADAVGKTIDSDRAN